MVGPVKLGVGSWVSGGGFTTLMCHPILRFTGEGFGNEPRRKMSLFGIP